ncbi:MAG: Flp pilus assembly complex ATPase component TadA [Nanoarchaeota archaeon]|nr:Flp pilus assembly complex ATPase component TadA [Nanoarchaeota archaeon]
MRESTIKRTTKSDSVYVPDTSIIIEGLVSEKIKKGELKGKILIHNAVMAELEHQANSKRPTGLLGIDEIKELKDLDNKGKIILEFGGSRPLPSQIRYAKKGEIDAIIRELAETNEATLLTGDKVQYEIAQAMGVKSQLIMFDKTVKGLSIEKYFDDTTMSVHLREETTPKAKKGKPGEWIFVELSDKKLTSEEVEELSKEIVEKTKMDSNSFLEIENRGSTIVQFRNYRIVMTRPPLSDGWEITAVRPVKILTLNDYNIVDKLRDRLKLKAEGILVAGAPGNGKSTFCQALATFYLTNNKIVKTIEAPRDLILPPEITQYSKNKASNAEIHDILLLSRPDYTIFDEIRNSEDFELFKDMRLSGVGMVGVVHATNPIDAIQRFIGRVELGMVPSIIDTVIFIEKGQIGRVLEVGITVRVPSGMTEADLARPLVEVKDFLSGELVYEMYTFGEQTVVVPVKGIKTTSVARQVASEVLKERIEKELPSNIPLSISMPSEDSIEIRVPKENIPEIIGRKGVNIEKLEKRIGARIQVREMDKEKVMKEVNREKKSLEYDIKFGKRSIEISLDYSLKGANVDIYLDDDYLLTATVSKNGSIKVSNKSDVGKKLVNAKNLGEEIRVLK